MNKAKITKEAISIKLVKTKESDAMITALGPEGLFSFYARGVSKITSKNAAAVQPLTYAKYSLVESSTGSLTLGESEPIASFLGLGGDLAQMAALSFIQEISSKLIADDEGAKDYPWLLAALTAIKNGFDPLSAALIYFAQLLKNGGVGLNVDSCVVCGKKENIVAISYQEGGFLCGDHFLPGVGEACGKRRLQILRYIFRLPINSFEKVSFEKDETVLLLESLARYVDSFNNLNLNSLSLFKVI
ncbi:MAG: DNA repair protein RecO [Bacilli bacterium]|nr:DNA repair protein RecO [Bacilli bacterium]